MPNRLANSSSVYLRAAAEHAIDWFPWGAEAFARARELDRPVLLDVGAAWCHYCHVMDDESYRDPKIAEFVNLNYVAVRVDCDERPDLDARYQASVSQLNGVSGWPLTAFLTPEGTLYFGGTYFSARPRGSNPGFIQILTWASELYKGSPERRAEEGRRLRQGLAGRSGWARGSAPVAESANLPGAASDLLDLYDRRHGGFGDEPKFLAPNALELWLRVARDPRQQFARMALAHTLSALTRGAVHDRLGGGFHRYATDAAFEVPHYEKLLCNQAEMLRFLTRAARELDVSGMNDPYLSWEIAEAARGTARYLLQTLFDPVRGTFAASQAASAGAEEGDSYRWTRDEVHAAVGPELTRAADQIFGLTRAPGPNPLSIRTPPVLASRAWKLDAPATKQRIQDIQARLTQVRSIKPAPPIDRTAIPAWNALAATALLEASRGFGEPGWRAAAEKAVDTLLTLFLRDDGAVVRAPHVPPQLADAVALAEACVELYEFSGDEVRIRQAHDLLRRAIELCWDPSSDAFEDRAARVDECWGSAWASHPFEDTTHISGNGLALRALDRFLLHREVAPFRDMADRLSITITKARANHEPIALAGALLALDTHRSPPPRVAVVGATLASRAPLVEAALAAALEIAVLEVEPTRLLAGDLDALVKASGGETSAFVCRGAQCSAPVHSAEDLQRVLASPPM